MVFKNEDTEAEKTANDSLLATNGYNQRNPNDKPKGDDENSNILTEKYPDEKNGDVAQVSKEEGAEEARDTWGGKLDFVMSTLSFTVGMGNLWRFPYLCYTNGGGAFLIPYLIMVVLIGVPVMYLEFVFGQYGRKGVVSIWKASPLFKGVGWVMIALSALVATYYNVLISWCFYYIVMSFRKELPWSNCANSWNSEKGCADIETMASRLNCTAQNGTWFGTSCQSQSTYYTSDGSLNNTVLNMTVTDVRSPSDEFFHYNMLDISEGIHDMGAPRWQLVLCLLFTWSLIAVCLSKGIKSSGKATYVTSLFPYVVLTILFIRGLMLDGAKDGILYLITPDFKKLLSPKIWGDAAIQMFFSLSLCWGGLITLASYNNFNNNVLRDAIVVTLGDTLTSVFGGVVIFSYIGYMANVLNTSVDNVATQGAGLAFIVYPQAVTLLPLPQLWSILFMVMLINVGTGTVFGVVQTIQATILDEVPMLSRGRRPLLVLICMCAVFFLLGIPYTTRGGIYLLQLVDNYAATYSVLFLGFSICVILSWVYGLPMLQKNIYDMMGYGPNIVFTIMWRFVTPGICLVILVFSIADYKRTSYNKETLPLACDIIGWAIPILQIALIPGFAIYQIVTCEQEGSIMEKIKYLCTPASDWGAQSQQQQSHNEKEMQLMSAKENQDV